MRRRRATFLAGLLLALAGLAAALLWSYRIPSGPVATPSPVISALTPAEATRIRVRHGDEMIVIQRDNPHAPWRLTAPVNAPVDQPHLRALLSLLGKRAQRRYNPGAIDDATTGLKSPRLIVQFNHNAPINIGADGPTQGSRYVGTAHDLLLAALPDMAGLHWRWTHWISPALLPPHRHLRKLVLPDFTLEPASTGRWRARPAGQRTGAAVTASLEAWQRARALTVTPADESRQRLARITLVLEHGPPRHLDVIERHPNLILRDPELGVDYHLAGNRIPPLLELRHRGL